MHKQKYLDFEEYLINEGYKREYQNYLISKGLKLESLSGKPSTVSDYVNWVKRISENENITWQQLANNIKIFLPKYDIGGKKEDYGKKSNKSAINALRHFSDFINHNVLNSQ